MVDPPHELRRDRLVAAIQLLVAATGPAQVAEVVVAEAAAALEADAAWLGMPGTATGELDVLAQVGWAPPVPANLIDELLETGRARWLDDQGTALLPVPLRAGPVGVLA